MKIDITKIEIYHKWQIEDHVNEVIKETCEQYKTTEDQIIALVAYRKNFREEFLRTRRCIGEINHNADWIDALLQSELNSLKDKLHSESVKKARLQASSKIPKSEETRNSKDLPQLSEIFYDQEKLGQLVNLLIDEDYVDYNEDSVTPVWTGLKHEEYKGPALQMVALSEVCAELNLYIKSEYQAKELHHAWTTFFGVSYSVTNFQKCRRQVIIDKYKELFSFVKHSFSIK
ncbi:MAG TPA: hypothetical protein P5228_03285 [Bacteroidales bacterium]|nr:hypothetical protein [Bacteroidales bacterium]HRZ49548.1 hypothetical protein [Bacteroidales bacterium]